MKTVNLSIKNVPVETVESLRGRARAHFRSLQGELLAVLNEAICPRSLTIEEARARLAELRLRTPDEATSLLREERDAK